MGHTGARGFSLVELLVVIGIVALLAAVAFPIFASARERGRQTACRSNVRQLGLGVLMYAQDCDDFLPPLAARNGTLWPLLISPYVHCDRVMLCPSDTTDTLNSYGLSEMICADLADPDPLPLLSLNAFGNSSSTVLLAELGVGTRNDPSDLQTPRLDSVELVSPGEDLDDGGDGRPSARHFGRVTVGFVDGHVEALRLDQFYTHQTPVNKWFTP